MVSGHMVVRHEMAGLQASVPYIHIVSHDPFMFHFQKTMSAFVPRKSKCVM